MSLYTPVSMAKSFSLRDTAIIASFRLSRKIIRLLPAKWVVTCCKYIGFIVGRLLSRDRKIALSQIRYAFPQGDPRDSADKSLSRSQGYEVLVDDVFRHVGESLGESLIIDRLFEVNSGPNSGSEALRLGIAPDFCHFTTDNQDVAYDALKDGKGAVGLSGHVGSFELLGRFLVHCGIPISAIGRKPDSPIFAEMLDELRQGYGVDTIWRDGPTAIRRIMQALKEGRVLAALIDQDTNVKSDFADFFGLPAASPIILIELAIRRRIPLFTSFIYRRGPLEHFVETRLIDYDPESPTAAIDSLAEYNRRLEAIVRRYPEQSVWWHRRWRRRPGIDYLKQPELLPTTKEYISWLDDQCQETLLNASPAER